MQGIVMLQRVGHIFTAGLQTVNSAVNYGKEAHYKTTDALSDMWL
jgi:hypothetical protein